jgi:hypothetical protein
MTMHMAGEAPAEADADDNRGMTDARFSWVVCLGTTRDASPEGVACPRQGAVNPSRCLECRLLVTIERERGPLLECSTGFAVRRS